MDKIYLKDLEFSGCHGVYEHEQRQKQDFRVNIELDVDTRAAAAADDLALTMDYSRLYEGVCRVVEQESFRLLETLAERIAGIALLDDKVEKVRVEVEKCRASAGERHFRSAVLIERGGG